MEVYQVRQLLTAMRLVGTLTLQDERELAFLEISRRKDMILNSTGSADEFRGRVDLFRTNTETSHWNDATDV